MMTQRWTRYILLAGLLLSELLLNVSARAEGPSIPLIQANGPLTSAMLSYVQRGIDQATMAGSPAIVIELDTPGGEITLMQSIVQAIRNSRVPVIVYVGPRGAMAASAGTMITLAGHLAAMAPETSIGAASPVGENGQELDSTLARKAKNILKASARELASRRGEKAITLAEAAIEDAQAVNAPEALAAGLIDFMADDVADVLRQADGRTVELQGSNPLTVHTSGLPISEVPQSWLEELGGLLANPALISILFLIGAQGILIELSHPGGWVPGTVGIVSLGLAFYGLGMLPVNWLGLGLIGLSFLLFLLDIKAPTHGALTTAGLAAMIGGFLVLFNSPGTPEYARVSIPLISLLSLATAAFFLFIVTRGIQAQRRPTSTGLGAVIGKPAIARTRLDPAGMVFVHGERWEATTAGEPVEEGDSVRVVGIRGLRLLVQSEPREVPPAPTAASEDEIIQVETIE
jgi:membrane-bound serine protease (ClpP class)